MKKIWIGAVGVSLLALLAGCGKTGNLFSFTHKGGNLEETDPAVLIADAQAAIEDGNYDEAKKLFEKAVLQDPTNSEARLGVVNTAVQDLIFGSGNNFDLLSFAENLGNFSGSPALFALDPLQILAPPATTRAHHVDIFTTNTTADYGVPLAKLEDLFQIFIKHLVPIVNGETDLPVDQIPSIYYVNLTLGYVLQGIFRILDPGLDGEVDYILIQVKATGDYQVFNKDDDPETANPITSADGIISSAVEAAGLADLDLAIVYIGKAKAVSDASTADFWTEIEKALTEFRDMIDNLI